MPVVAAYTRARGRVRGVRHHMPALVPVHRTLDLKALAAAHGARRARMAKVADAERASGYVAGGNEGETGPLGRGEGCGGVEVGLMECMDVIGHGLTHRFGSRALHATDRSRDVPHAGTLSFHAGHRNPRFSTRHSEPSGAEGSDAWESCDCRTSTSR